jgi:hypothetical protein
MTRYAKIIKLPLSIPFLFKFIIKIFTMKVGDRIKVQESVLVYHHPQHKKEAFDIQGMEGELIEIVTEWQGRPVSANFPYLVKFDKKFKAHFREDEIISL